MQVQRARPYSAEVVLDPAAVLEEAQIRAKEIVADAQAEASALAGRAAAEAQKCRQDAISAGREEGYRAGYEAATQETSSLIAEAREALAAAREAFSEMAATAEPRMLALALDSAKRITSEALSVNPEIVLDLIRKGMSAMKDEREFSLRVDPDLVALVEGSADGLGKEFAARSVEVVPDDSAKGGAIVRTPHGFVDVTLESQIRNISLALAEARKRVQEKAQ